MLRGGCEGSLLSEPPSPAAWPNTGRRRRPGSLRPPPPAGRTPPGGQLWLRGGAQPAGGTAGGWRTAAAVCGGNLVWMRAGAGCQQCTTDDALSPPPAAALQDEAVWEFDSWGEDLPAALRLLCAEVGGDAVVPGTNCRGIFSPAARPPLPQGESPSASGFAGVRGDKGPRRLSTGPRCSHPPTLQAASPLPRCARRWRRCSLRAPSLWTSPSPAGAPTGSTAAAARPLPTSRSPVRAACGLGER